jgi:hypothetical protein
MKSFVITMWINYNIFNFYEIIIESYGLSDINITTL